MKRFYEGNMNPLVITEESTKQKRESSPKDHQSASHNVAQPSVSAPQAVIGNMIVRGIRAVGRTISSIYNPRQMFGRGTVAPSRVHDALSTSVRETAPSTNAEDNHQTVVTDNNTMKERSHTVVPNTKEDQSTAVVLQTIGMQNLVNIVLPGSVDKWAWTIGTVLVTAAANVKSRAVVSNTNTTKDQSHTVIPDTIDTTANHKPCTPVPSNNTKKVWSCAEVTNTDCIKNWSHTVVPNTVDMKDQSNTVLPCTVEKWTWPRSTVPNTVAIKGQLHAVEPSTSAIKDQSHSLISDTMVTTMNNKPYLPSPSSSARKHRSRAVVHNTGAIKDQSCTVIPKTSAIRDQSCKLVLNAVSRKDRSRNALPSTTDTTMNRKPSLPAQSNSAKKDWSSTMVMNTDAMKDRSCTVIPKTSAIRDQSCKLVPNTVSRKDRSRKVLPSTTDTTMNHKTSLPASSRSAKKDWSSTVVTNTGAMKNWSCKVDPGASAMKDQSHMVDLNTDTRRDRSHRVLPLTTDTTMNRKPSLPTPYNSAKKDCSHAVVTNIGAMKDQSCNVARYMEDQLHALLLQNNASKDQTHTLLSNTVATKNRSRTVLPSTFDIIMNHKPSSPVPSNHANKARVHAELCNTGAMNGWAPAVLPNTGAIKDQLRTVAPIISVIKDRSPAVKHKTRGMFDKSYRLALEKGFTIHEILGKGAFGNVVLASHPATHKMLALKIIEKKIGHDPRTILREVQLLEAVRNNPFITHLYGSFQSEDQFVFVMEYLSGGDLKKLIRRSAPLPEDTIRNLTAEILCGLEFLHSKNIMHRDLKPENILLDDASHAKIADLGLSVFNVTEHRRITGCNGTVAYMAPEVIRGDPYFTVADYFSLGLIVYEMAASMPPFYSRQKTKQELLTTILSKKVYYPLELNHHLCDVIRKLLHLDQEIRKDLVKDLRGRPFFKNFNWAKLQKRPSAPEIQFGSYF